MWQGFYEFEDISFECTSIVWTQLGATLSYLHGCVRCNNGFYPYPRRGKKPYTIYYIRKNLTTTELNYTVTEKEFLAVVYSIKKFRHYITRYQVFLYTGHFSITYLSKKKITNSRVTRWLLLLQEFDIIMKYRSGKENRVVDFLFQVPKINDPMAVDD